MPNRRDTISMDEDEIWQFIESQKTVQVCSINKDGSPHLVPMWFFVSGKSIVLVSYTKSQKIRNLQRNSKIAILFEDGDEYENLVGVSINADASLLDDPDEVQSMEKKLIIRNQAEQQAEDIEEMTRKSSSKKTAIVITPSRIVSWDHRKLDVSY